MSVRWRIAVAMLFCACANLFSSLSLASSRANDHAPIGVMADHVHSSGEWMLSYKYMHMHMQGNRDGTKNLSSCDIVTTVPNTFFGAPMQPASLRVVPTEMKMEMHMLGIMYAPTDVITLMLMGSYQKREMQHQTFAGPAGSTKLGDFETRSQGWGDPSVSALVSISPKWHMELGVSLPLGGIEETDTVLTPMNTMPSLRLPYPMQLGSGSYDPILAINYNAHSRHWGWGAQWRSTLRVFDNSEDYRLGSSHKISAWASYLATQHLSLSVRMDYFLREKIRGQDPLIVAPVQTANPDFQAAQAFNIDLGTNYVLPGGKHRLAFELALPVYQNLDGPQLKTDWALTAGWQFAF